MAKITHRTFDGLLPRLSARLLPEDGAQVAEACRFKGGHVEPLKGLGASVATVSADPVTLWPWRYRDAEDVEDQLEWISFSHETGVVRSPVHGDEYWRIYHTDSDGALQCRHRKGGATVTRAAGLTAPAAPAVTVAEVLGAETLRGLPDTYVKVQATYAFIVGSVAQISLSDTVTCALDAVDVDEDGTIAFRFAVPGAGLGRGSYELGTLESAYTHSFSVAVTEIKINGTLIHYAGAAESVVVDDGGDPAVELGTLTYKTDLGYDVYGSSNGSYNDVSGSPGHTLVSVRPELLSGKAAVRMYIDHGAAFASEHDCYYVQATVDDLGEESPASELSELVHVPAGYAAMVGAITLAGNLEARRIYRTATGVTPEHDDFYFCGENDGTAYTDTKSDAELAEVLPRIENPPEEMYGLVALPGGVLAAFKGRDIFLSEPFLPYSWPEAYRLTVADDAVALCVADRDLYVLTRSGPWVVSGTHPETMAEARIPLEQGCASGRAVAVLGGRCFYASPDGVVSLVGGQGRLDTHSHMTRREWQAYGPDTMAFSAHDGALVISTGGDGGLVWEQAEGRLDALSSHDLDFGAMYTDGLTDTLYVTVGTGVCPWQGGDALTLRWRGREEVTPVPVHFAAVRVVADSYPVTVRLFAEGVQVVETTVASGTSKRIARLRPERVWSVEMEADGAVHELSVATSVGELRR